MTNKVLITGGTGLVGSCLSEKLKNNGFDVFIMSRQNHSKNDRFITQFDMTQNPSLLADFDVIIHLAGANISKGRWTKKRKQEIIDSRVETAHFLYKIIRDNNIHLKTFITASAVGYYGTMTSDEILTENDASGCDFLSSVCKKWENIADIFESVHARVVKIRTGVVLAKKHSALQKMVLPVKLFLGTPLGNGKQYLPWIHIDDLCDIYMYAVNNQNISGTYNAAAPQYITNKQFTKILAEMLKKPFYNIPLPSFILKLALGQMSSVLLDGSRVSSEKLQKTGYTFKYIDLEKALRDLIKK